MRTFQCLLAVVLLAVARAQAGEGATAVATLTAGFVTAITVTHGGSGYLAEPSVVIAGGGGSGATAKAILQGDKVSAIVVLTAGSGYTTVPTVAIEAAPKALGLRWIPSSNSRWKDPQATLPWWNGPETSPAHGPRGPTCWSTRQAPSFSTCPRRRSVDFIVWFRIPAPSALQASFGFPRAPSSWAAPRMRGIEAPTRGSTPSP